MGDTKTLRKQLIDTKCSALRTVQQYLPALNQYLGERTGPIFFHRRVSGEANMVNYSVMSFSVKISEIWRVIELIIT